MENSVIKKLRKADKESQEVWGAKFNLTRGKVDSYERAKANPTNQTVQEICTHYGITIDDYYNKNIERKPDPITDLIKAKDALIKIQAELIEYLKAQLKTLTEAKAK